MAEKTEQWGSRWGLILASMGAAVGTGNIWRFPKEVASNGGGSFLIPWLIFLVTWSIPLLMIEFTLGKKTRYGTVGMFKKFAGPKYAWMGAWMMVVSALINFYYAVVMGWVLRYFYVAFTGGLTAGVDTMAMWQDFLAHPEQIVFFQFVAVFLGWFITQRGVSAGIEKVNMVLVPALFGLLIVAAIWAVSLPGSINGLIFMFKPQPEYLMKASTWISALAQSAWSCSAGMGMAITYAVYMKKKEDTVLNSFITGFGNNAVSLVAGIAVICTVFAMSPTVEAGVGVMNAGSTGLTFIHLTELFVMLPGGTVMAALFFMAMSFAALTSLITGFEISTRNFMDHGLDRKKAVNIVAIGSFILGLPSAVIILWVSGEPITVFLDNQDHVWGLGLIISGLFVAFAVHKYGVERFRDDLLNVPTNDLRIGMWWVKIVKYFFPILFTVLIIWFFYQTYTSDSHDWWVGGPVGLFLMVSQWGLVLALLYKYNGWINKQELVSRDEDDEDEDDDDDDDAQEDGEGDKTEAGGAEVAKEDDAKSEEIKAKEGENSREKEQSDIVKDNKKKPYLW